MVKFLFSVHTITEAKQSNRQGGARAVDLPDLARPGAAPPLVVIILIIVISTCYTHWSKNTFTRSIEN